MADKSLTTDTHTHTHRKFILYFEIRVQKLLKMPHYEVKALHLSLEEITKNHRLRKRVRRELVCLGRRTSKGDEGTIPNLKETRASQTDCCSLSKAKTWLRIMVCSSLFWLVTSFSRPLKFKGRRFLLLQFKSGATISLWARLHYTVLPRTIPFPQKLFSV